MPANDCTHLDRSNPAVITQVCEWHRRVGRLLPYLLPTPPLRPADALAKRGELAAKTVLKLTLVASYSPSGKVADFSAEKSRFLGDASESERHNWV